MVQRSVTVRDNDGYQPVVADIRTARGVVVTGRVTDGATGKPVPARVTVGRLGDNPHARKPEYDSFGATKSEDTGADGTFRVIAIPGRVLLIAGPDGSRFPGGFLESLRYCRPTADPRFPDYFRSDLGSEILFYRESDRGAEPSWAPVDGYYCKVLKIEPGTAEVRANVVLERATAMRLSLRDGVGHPVAGTWLAGITPYGFTQALWSESAEVEVYEVGKGSKPRQVTFFDPKDKLTATMTLKGNEKQPVTITLKPAGLVKGRLLNPDGSPAARVTVGAQYSDDGTQKVFQQAQGSDGCVLTDKDGTFRFDRMIPGPTFTLLSSQPSKQGLFRTPTRPVADGRAFGPVKSGKTADLGELTLKATAQGNEE
jgi:hypothetical protein